MKQIFAVLTATLLLISCKDKNLIDNKKELSSNVELMELKAGEEEKDKQYSGFLPDSAGTPQTKGPEKNVQQSKQVPLPNPDWDKKIIKTASLNIEINDYNRYNTELREKVNLLGGYVAQEEQTQSDYKIENILIIKIPVDQFDNAVNQLSANIEKLNEKKITSQDVTSEVVDTKSRLEAKKQMRLKYLDFLKQSKNMEEVLQVQKEINEIQEEIESATGRVNYLTKQAAYSTINLCFFQPMPGFIPNGNKPAFFTRLADAFRSGVDWFADLFIGLIFMWPFFVIAIILLILWKRYRAVKPIRQNV